MTTSERLMKAKELLIRDGWITGLLRANMTGEDPTDFRRCALGSIFDVDGNVDYHVFGLLSPTYDKEHNKLAIRYLAAAIPGEFHGGSNSSEEFRACQSKPSQVAIYNNTQSDIKVILAWFDRAIELAQAAEMYRELESTVPVVVEQEEARGELVRA